MIGFIPEILRIDRGLEISIFIDVYYFLRAENDRLRDRRISDIIPHRNYRVDGDGQLLLEHYYYFGISTRNLAVEV